MEDGHWDAIIWPAGVWRPKMSLAKSCAPAPHRGEISRADDNEGDDHHREGGGADDAAADDPNAVMKLTASLAGEVMTAKRFRALSAAMNCNGSSGITDGANLLEG